MRCLWVALFAAAYALPADASCIRNREQAQVAVTAYVATQVCPGVTPMGDEAFLMLLAAQGAVDTAPFRQGVYDIASAASQLVRTAAPSRKSSISMASRGLWLPWALPPLATESRCDPVIRRGAL
jgi:hypothetical protein